MRMSVSYLYVLGLCVLLGSCSSLCSRGHKDLSPEEVVQAYLDTAFNMVSVAQKEKLIQYTTGPLYESIAQASDQTIREAYVDKRYVLMSYSVSQRRDRTPRETEITFELVYRNEGKEGANDKLSGKSAPTVTTENTVSVIRKKGLWLISDVLNKTTSFDFPVADPCTEVTPTPRPECESDDSEVDDADGEGNAG